MKLVLVVLLFAGIYEAQSADFVTCTRNYAKIGCFWEDKDNMELLINDRDKTHATHQEGHVLNWKKFGQSTHSLACRCALLAREKFYTYFSIRFFGECWGGKDIGKLEETVKDPSKISKQCRNHLFKECSDDAAQECAGRLDAEYIYKLMPADVPTGTDGGFSEWGEWTDCTNKCGGGEKTRERTCTEPEPEGKGADCQGETTETVECNQQVCPTEAPRTCGDILELDPNRKGQVTGNDKAVPGEWTLCYIDHKMDKNYFNAECKDLIKNVNGFANSAALKAAGGDFGCWHGNSIAGKPRGATYANNNVVSMACRNNVQQSTKLTAWSQTTTTMGVCIKIPSAPVIVTPVDCKWSAWGALSACSHSCGKGTQIRSRTSTPAQHGGKGCIGSMEETKECQLKECPKAVSLCGNNLHMDKEQKGVPAGWVLCYIDGTDTSLHATKCKDLIENAGVNGKYTNSQKLLASGGNYGCWHGTSAQGKAGGSFASNNVVKSACRNNIQHTTKLNAWTPTTTTLGVCLKMP